jgi:tagaturonate reductase
MKQLSTQEINKPKRPIKIIQFGGRSFTRSTVDWFLQKLNNQQVFYGSVALIPGIDETNVDELMEQDGLYFVNLKSNTSVDEETLDLIDIIDHVHDSSKHPDSYLFLAQNNDIEFIITDTSASQLIYQPILIDESASSQSQLQCQILSLMHRRFRNKDTKHGYKIICCEQVENNAKLLKDALLKLAQFNNLSSEFISWMKKENSFYCSCIDRLTKKTRNEDMYVDVNVAGKKELFFDKNLVIGERYHHWVIQGRELKEQFGFQKTDLNVEFVDDYLPFAKQLQIIKLINAITIPSGFLGGFIEVGEVVKNPIVVSYFKKLIREEVINLLGKQINNETFLLNLIQRMTNPALRRKLDSLSYNLNERYVLSLVPLIFDNYEVNNTIAKYCIFALALLFSFYMHADGIESFKGNPDLLIWKQKYAKNEQNLKKTVVEVLRSTQFGEYAILNIPNVLDTILLDIDLIAKKGFLEAMATI